jgi:ABC-type transport system involved in multi-copper enzyme maturation permease subunit
VNDLLLVLFGPLIVPECRRAGARGWLILARFLAGGLLALVLWSLLWYWWLYLAIDSLYDPAQDVRQALWVSALVLVTVVVLMVPAVLAGSLAGERERGVLQLLLTTAATPREIVLGRLIGKLSQVGMVLLAGVPVIAILAAWNGLGIGALATIVLVLASIAIGEGGMSLLASIVSRRGRDALFAVYAGIMILYLSPFLDRVGLPAQAAMWLQAINPYFSVDRLIGHHELAPALVCSAIWLLLGASSVGVASVRLRPSCLAAVETVARRQRRRAVPPIGERPMLWKELYIERVGTLGRFGRWLGVLVTLVVGGASLALAGVAGWALFWRYDLAWADWATNELGSLLQDTGLVLGVLLQFGIGLRAAVSIASERDRATWDALLVTPLKPNEIVPAKLYGSLNALRWMAGAMIMAWTLGVALGAVSGWAYANWMAGIVTGGTFMAAMGVRSSLAMPSATRAMASVIFRWLVMQAVVAFASLAIIMVGLTVCLSVWVSAIRLGLIPPNAPPTRFFPMSWSLAWALCTNIVLLVITMLVVTDTRLRFDRIGGRITGGTVASSVDAFLYGHALQPVFLPSGRPKTKTKAKVKSEPEPVGELS